MTRGARRELVREVKLSTGDVGVLLCADGMVVMAESEVGLQSSLQALSEAMGRWDFKACMYECLYGMLQRLRIPDILYPQTAHSLLSSTC